MRCPNTNDCKFFLWEKDELTAKVSKSEPRTPQHNRRRTPALLTPVSRHDTQGRRESLHLESSISTPTPKRVFDHVGVPDQPLLTEILDLLKSANIEIKASTELQLRHSVNMRMATYETKVRTCEATIDELRAKLVELGS